MSLKIDVAPLLQETGRESQLSLKENLSWPEDGLNVEGPLLIEADLINTDKRILLNAKINGKVELECSRCLKKFALPLRMEFEEEYSHNIPPVHKKRGEVELTNADFIFKIDKDNTIDLGESVRQNLLAELPIKPLCSQCPEGGK